MDVNSFQSQANDKPNRSETVRNFVSGNFDLTRTFYTHPKILVVALNGPAVGLSAALVAVADFIYAAPHAYLLTPFSSLGLVAEGGSSHTFVERLGISKANEALIMSKPITCEELAATGFVNKVIASPSGRADDSAGFLTLVLKEVEERLGPHLNQQSLLKIKELIRRPQREALDRQNGLEAFMGMERLMTGAPQIEFRKISSGEKAHKL
jgi:peroxisomal 3,2-trans-enoyl-CoA isomerase